MPQLLSYSYSPPKSPMPPPVGLAGVGGIMWEAWNRSAVRRYNKLHAAPQPKPKPTLNPHLHPSPKHVPHSPSFSSSSSLTRYNKLHERREDERYCDELPCAVPARPEAPAADGAEGRGRLGDTTVGASVLI